MYDLQSIACLDLSSAFVDVEGQAIQSPLTSQSLTSQATRDSSSITGDCSHLSQPANPEQGLDILWAAILAAGIKEHSNPGPIQRTGKEPNGNKRKLSVVEDEDSGFESDIEDDISDDNAEFNHYEFGPRKPKYFDTGKDCFAREPSRKKVKVSWDCDANNNIRSNGVTQHGTAINAGDDTNSSDSDTSSDSDASNSDTGSDSDDSSSDSDTSSDSDDQIDLSYYRNPCPTYCVCRIGCYRTIPPMKRKSGFRVVTPLYQKLLKRRLIYTPDDSCCCDRMCSYSWRIPSRQRMVKDYKPSDLNVYHFRWGTWKDMADEDECSMDD